MRKQQLLIPVYFFKTDEHEILFVPLDSCGKISEKG